MFLSRRRRWRRSDCCGQFHFIVLVALINSLSFDFCFTHCGVIHMSMILLTVSIQYCHALKWFCDVVVGMRWQSVILYVHYKISTRMTKLNPTMSSSKQMWFVSSVLKHIASILESPEESNWSGMVIAFWYYHLYCFSISARVTFPTRPLLRISVEQ